MPQESQSYNTIQLTLSIAWECHLMGGFVGKVNDMWFIPKFSNLDWEEDGSETGS